MHKSAWLVAVLATSVVVLPSALFAGDGGFAGVTNCYINGRWITVKGNCPASSGGGGTSSGSGGGGAMYNGLYGASYQLGYAFGQWLFGSGSDPQAEQQKRLMMEELQRRQAEAERQHREEEARRLAAIYNRLASTLKLSGVPNLQLKEGSSGGGLKLKLGDGADGPAGIKGLPGIYLNDGKTPYGIPGLPGTYTGGPGQGSGLTASGLKLKAGDGSGADPQPAAAQATAPVPEQVAQAALPDPAGMTPQQMADVVAMVSQLPPEAQQEMWNAVQRDAAVGQMVTGTSGPLPAESAASLQQQVSASKAAASATVPEDASAKARVGFDTPLGHPPADLPMAMPPPSTPPPAAGVEPPPVAAGGPRESSDDYVKMYLFPGPFPKNPDPPLMNPLREGEKLQAELKTHDDRALQQADYAYRKSDDPLYPATMERAILNASAVKDYAPDLFARYERNPSFRKDVDQALDSVTRKAVLDYYQGQAEANKAAIRAFHEELGKLAAAGKLDRLVPLEEQFRLHPERRQLVEDVRIRLAAEEAAAVEIAKAVGILRLKEEYRNVFSGIRGKASRLQEKAGTR